LSLSSCRVSPCCSVLFRVVPCCSVVLYSCAAVTFLL
jgi:hypothetical protein